MLWFDNQAEEAANFYVSVFKNSKVKQITHYTGEEFPEKKGQVMTVSFELNGQEFTALNGGPDFKFTEAVSFVINCDMRDSMEGMYDDNFYFNNPVDYMANQNDPWFLHQYASCDIRLVTGCGPWENSGPPIECPRC